MATCPQCWQPKPLFSERCHHCNTVVDPLDTAGTSIALFLFRVFGFFVLIFLGAAILSAL